MSNYVVLYRKYRPETLEDVVGRKYIIQSLKNAIKNNTLSHAYLFCGPRGTGKTSIARIFAREINNGIDADEDIIEIDAASNNGIDEIRSLIDRVKYAPIKGKYKIYIIDEVHMMTSGAFNAFLKTIEEPPEHVIFILATTEPHKVLDTILSRCQRYDFKSFTNEELISRINYVAEQEKIELEKGVAEEIAKLANGGMRDALSILDQLSTYGDKKINLVDINVVYGTLSIKDKYEILNLLKNNAFEEIVKWIDDNLKDKNIEYKLLINDLIDILKEKLINKNHDEQKQNLINWTNNDIFNVIEILIDMLGKMTAVKNAKTYFEIVLIKIHELLNSKTQNQLTYNNNILNNSDTDTKIINKKEIKEEKLNIEEKEVKLENKKSKQIDEPIIEEIPMIKNVSRETLEDEFVLRLLVSANKEIKLADKKQINEHGRKLILDDYKNIKYINIFKNSEIIAAGESFILLQAIDEISRNEMLECVEQNECKLVVEKMFGINKKIFVVEKQHIKKIIDLFKQRRETNSLPEKISFDIEKVQQQVEKSSLEKIIDLFGSEHVEIKEKN